MTLKFLLLILLLFQGYLSSAVILNEDGNTYCDGTGWVEYKDEKCFKLIAEWATRDKARDMCSKELLQSDSSTTQLATIKSADEQAFLSKYIFDISAVEINVWIGAMRVNNSSSFMWDDDSKVDFANWAQNGSPTGDVKRKCVEMQSKLTRKLSFSASDEIVNNEGKWRDVTCKQPNYVVCEKLQRWSIGKLQQTLLYQRKELNEAKKNLSKTKENLIQATNRLSDSEMELNVTKIELSATKSSLNETAIRLSAAERKIEVIRINPVPIGFIYVQLPKEKTPKEIWPIMAWLDVSSAYANIFFRVQGDRTASFGKMQEENAPRITGIHNQLWCEPPIENVYTVIGGNSGPIQTGGWNFNRQKQCIFFSTSGGEVRPRNMAMRVWRRTA